MTVQTSMNPKKIAIIAIVIVVSALIVIAVASWLDGSPEVAAGAGAAAVIAALGAARGRAADTASVVEAKAKASEAGGAATLEAEAIGSHREETHEMIDAHRHEVDKNSDLAKSSNLSDLVDSWVDDGEDA